MENSHSVEYNLSIFTLSKNKHHTLEDYLPERIKIRPLNDHRAYENVKVILQVKNQPGNVAEYELRCHLVTTDVGDRLNLSPYMLKTDNTKEHNYRPVIQRIAAYKTPAGTSTAVQQYDFKLDFWIGSGKVGEGKSILAKKYEEAEKLYKIEELCEKHNRIIAEKARSNATDCEKKASDFFQDNKKTKLFLAFDVYQKFSNGQLESFAVRKYSNEIVDGNAMNINVICTTHVPTISADGTGTLVYLMVRDILFPYRMFLKFTEKTNELEKENMVVIEPSTVVPSHRSLSYKIPDYPYQNDTRPFIPCKLQLISDSSRSESNEVDFYYVNLDLPNQIYQLREETMPMSVDEPQAVDLLQHSETLIGQSSTNSSQRLAVSDQQLIEESWAPDESLPSLDMQGQSTGCQSANMVSFNYQGLQQPTYLFQHSETLTGQSSTNRSQRLAVSDQQLIEESWAPNESLPSLEMQGQSTGCQSANMVSFNYQGLQQPSYLFQHSEALNDQSSTNGSQRLPESDQLLIEESWAPGGSLAKSYFDGLNEVKERPIAHAWKDCLETDVFKCLIKLEKLINERPLTSVEIMNIISKLNSEFMRRRNTKKSLLEFAIKCDQFYQLDLVLVQTITNEKVLNDVRKRIGSMCNQRRETLLHAACKYNKSDFIRTLIDMRLDAILVQNTSGDTPLHLAIMHDAKDILEELTKLEIFRESTQLIELLDMHNIGGRTVLHLAVEHNNRPLVRMLLNRCDQHKKNALNSRVLGSGKTLLHLAVDLQMQCNAMVELIREHYAEADNCTNYAGYNPYGVYQDGKYAADDDNERVQDEDNDDVGDEKYINRIAEQLQQIQIEEKPL